MPVFDVTDPATGYQVTLEGDSPPTEQELEDVFRVVDARKRPISARAAIPEPGQVNLLAARPAQLSGVPQAFPAVEQAMEETAQVPGLSLSEARAMLQTPQVGLPREPFQAPGLTLLGKVLPEDQARIVQGVNAGVANLNAGLLEQAVLTPASGPMALASIVPGVRIGLGAGLTGLGAVETYEAGKQALETKDPQDITEAIGMGALTALGALATGADLRYGPNVRDYGRRLWEQNFPRRVEMPFEYMPPEQPPPLIRPRRLLENRTIDQQPETPTQPQPPGDPNAIPKQEAASVSEEIQPAPGAQVGQEVRQQDQAAAPQEAVAKLTPDQARNQLRQEGVSAENVEALLAGRKSVAQVVEEQLGVTRKGRSIDAATMIVEENPDGSRSIGFSEAAGPAASAPRNVGTMSHADAIQLASEEAIDRIQGVLGEMETAAAPLELPKVPELPDAKGMTPEQKQAAFDVYRGQMDQYDAQVQAWEAAQPRNRPIIFDRGQGSYVVITPDPLGGWRATSFNRPFRDVEQVVPWGHERYKTRGEAVKYYAHGSVTPLSKFPAEVLSEPELKAMVAARRESAPASQTPVVGPAPVGSSPEAAPTEEAQTTPAAKAAKGMQRRYDSPNGTVKLSFPSSGKGYVHGLYVNPKARGKGEGLALMARVTEDADKFGKTLATHTRPDLVPFFERFGFKRLSEDDYGQYMERPPEAAPSGKTPTRRAKRERPWDIIDEIESSVGKIRLAQFGKPGSEGFYNELYKEAAGGSARRLFDEVGMGPDDALGELIASGVFPPEADVDDVWRAIIGAKAQRRSAALGTTPEAQAGRFAKALEKQFKKKRVQPASVNDLVVGDKFTIGKEEMVVNHIDPETGDVQLEDGRKFGYQTVPEGAEIPVDRGSFVAAPRSSALLPDEFGLQVPETHNLAALRIAREKYLAGVRRRAARGKAAPKTEPMPEPDSPGLEGWADKVIREKLRGTSANPFLDPEFMAAATVKGVMLLKRGITNFARWAAEMRKELARPDLTDAQLTMVFERAKNPGPMPKRIPADTFDPSKKITPVEQVMGAVSGGAMDITRTVEQLGQRFNQLAHEWIWTRGEMPPWMYALKKRMEGQKSVAEFEMKVAKRALMDALADHYGFSSIRVPSVGVGRVRTPRIQIDWEVAGGGSRRIPMRAVEAMDDYLKGNLANPLVIPPRIRAALDTMRADITRLSGLIEDELIQQQGRFPIGSPGWHNMQDLIDTIDANLDVYMHRSYEFFEDPKRSVDQYWQDLNPAVRQAAVDSVMLANPTWPPTRAESFLRNWLNDLQQGLPAGPSAKLGAKELSILMRRNQLSPEYRALLGEHRSPILNYTKSVTKMTDWLAKQQFLNEVRRQGLGTLFFESDQAPPGFNKLIAAEGSDVMSPLNGLRTSEQMLRIFEEMNKQPSSGPLARLYLHLNAISKWAAVVPSPMTQARNMVGRPLMAALTGHWDTRLLPQAWAIMKMDLTGRAPDRWLGMGPPTPAAYTRSLLEDARRLKIIDDSGRSGELLDTMENTKLQDIGPGELFSWSAAQALKHYGVDLPTSWYRGSDNLGSLFGWLNEINNQQRIHPTWSVHQVREEAARIARMVYPMYSETPKIIKFASRVPLFGMFITFPYHAKRTIVNTIRQGVHEARSSNPVEQGIGYKRLAGVGVALLAPFALQEASKIIVGINGQQEEDFRRMQAAHAKNSKQLFTGQDRSKAEVGAVNLSYSDPYSALTDTFIAGLRSLKAGDPASDAAWKMFLELTDPYRSEQALFNAVREAYEGVTDEGRRIFNKTDAPMEKLQKQINHAERALWPALAQRLEKRIVPALKGEQPVFGRKLEPGREIFSEITGFRMEKHSYKIALDFRARDFRADDYYAEQVFHDAVSRIAKSTPEEVVEAYKESDQRRFQIWKEMRRDFLATVRGGVFPPDAQKILEGRGVAKRDANLIAQGVYKPNPISDASREKALKAGRVIPEAEINIYQLGVDGKSLDE